MSLRAALSAAMSSRAAVEARMAITARNIANADTPGYTRKVPTLSARTGHGVGVVVDGISSTADRYLIKAVLAASTTLGRARQIATFHDSLGKAMGALDSDGKSGTSLATSMGTLTDALKKMANTPESTILPKAVAAAADDMAAHLRSTSAALQNLRKQADNSLQAQVDTVNAALETIDTLNRQIAQGQDTSDLEDQRNAALKVIAEQMNITSFTDGNGAVKVYASDGTALLDGSVHKLSFSAAGTMDAKATYPDHGLSGITVDGKDITSAITGGSIGGLLQVRDKDLPAVQNELDELAQTLAEKAAPPTMFVGKTASDIKVPDNFREAIANLSPEEAAKTVQKLVNSLTGQKTSFGQAGNLPARKTSFCGYIAAIISDVSSSLDSAKTALTSAETGYATQANALAVASGVNLDEEAAQMSTLKNAYSVAATLISTIDDMFEELLNAVR